ncbi:MAG TPA: polyhydroxyalkanoate synthesis repressor PhaR [Gammaproteobacteria bacterium]|nr:polyhydroxyalkanoate synthesis repressor PhaR [Gammaproteobacteria bacterium]
MSAEPRIIKKYPNRRIYDTRQSRYITLNDLKDLIISGEEVRVVDASNGDDITRCILLQIINEQEAGGNPIFTTEVLLRMIRFYGDTMQGALTQFLGRSMEAFINQQQHYQQGLQSMFDGNSLLPMTELAQKNLEAWQEMQSSFLSGLQPVNKYHNKD